MGLIMIASLKALIASYFLQRTDNAMPLLLNALASYGLIFIASLYASIASSYLLNSDRAFPLL
jgi:hypothetical protein